MDWKIDYWEKDGIVFVKVLNPVNLEGTIQICVEANALAKKHHAHRYLVDHRGMDVAMSILDINQVPAKFKEVKADFNGETAILMDPSSQAEDRLEFLKNVLFLASMHFELFYDEEKALAWLKSV
jgi:hypothetical protein